MGASALSLGIAFVAGLVSFLSPCVLPILPGFLAYLAGDAGQPGAQAGPSRLATFISSVFFVVGFSVMFAIVGVALNTVLASFAAEAQGWLARIGGAIVIFFGLYLTGLIRVKFLERPHALRVTWKPHARQLTAFLFGAAFAAGWTPCVGAALGAILGIAAAQPSAAFALLMTYSLGLGVPFLILGAFAGSASGFLARFAKAADIVSRIFGVILIVLGILIATQELAVLADFSLVTMLLHS
ncbi:MAG TPA: cytochrome c biogenesis protein CcdA [Candidatus Paceibacterota bacterium]|nr:cytochrome c biogenesis protein CcdA [Candidatus Paceibacterota bacterium]